VNRGGDDDHVLATATATSRIVLTLTAGTFPSHKKSPAHAESSVAPGIQTRTHWRAESIGLSPPLGRWPVNTCASTSHPECVCLPCRIAFNGAVQLKAAPIRAKWSTLGNYRPLQCFGPVCSAKSRNEDQSMTHTKAISADSSGRRDIVFGGSAGAIGLAAFGGEPPPERIRFARTSSPSFG